MAVVYKGGELEFFFAGAPIATGTIDGVEWDNVTWGDVEFSRYQPIDGMIGWRETEGTFGCSVEITGNDADMWKDFILGLTHPKEPIILHQEDWEDELSLSGDGDGSYPIRGHGSGDGDGTWYGCDFGYGLDWGYSHGDGRGSGYGHGDGTGHCLG